MTLEMLSPLSLISIARSAIQTITSQEIDNTPVYFTESVAKF